jgi:hypothetical protein
MFKTCSRLTRAWLGLALTLAAGTAASAQDSTAKAGYAVKVAARKTQKGSQSGGGQGQQGQQQNRPAPLKADEKIKRSFRAAFLSPAPYVASIIGGGITQIGEDRLPHKDGGDEVADWGSRSARRFATRTTTTLFASGFYAAAFKQDPRYERSQHKNVGRRTLHAISRVFVTRGDNGHLQPNFSRFAGVMTASALANVWEHSTPGHDRVGADATLRRFSRSFATGALSNIVLREFLPDIIGIFRH